MLAACAPLPPQSRSVHQDPDYGPHSLDDRTLIILPIAMRDSGDPQDFRTAFGNESLESSQDAALQGLFMQSMIELADHVFPDMEPVRAGDSAASRRFEAPRPGADSTHPFSFRFPKALRPLGDTVKPDLGLQLADIDIRRKDRNTAGIPVRLPSDLTGDFALSGDFLIWDYTAAKPVAYGRFESVVPFDSMTQSVWKESVRQATGHIVRSSPLYGPKLQGRDERMKYRAPPALIYFPPPRIFIPQH